MKEILEGIENISGILRRMELQIEDTQQEAEIHWQWNAVATVMERIFLFVFLILLCALSLVIILPPALKKSAYAVES